MSMDEGEYRRRVQVKRKGFAGAKVGVDLSRDADKSLREVGQDIMTRARHKHTRGTDHPTKRLQVSGKANRKAQRAARRRQRG